MFFKAENYRHPAFMEGDCSAQFPVSRPSIGATDFLCLNFGCAAAGVDHDADRIDFERQG
jgi:hypothetical protein